MIDVTFLTWPFRVLSLFLIACVHLFFSFCFLVVFFLFLFFTKKIAVFHCGPMEIFVNRITTREWTRCHYQGMFYKKCFSSILKMDYSKRKEFAPEGSKFFPFGVDPFQKGFGVQKSKQEVTKIFSFLQILAKVHKVYQVTLKWHRRKVNSRHNALLIAKWY